MYLYICTSLFIYDINLRFIIFWAIFTYKEKKNIIIIDMYSVISNYMNNTNHNNNLVEQFNEKENSGAIQKIAVFKE